MRSQQQMGMEQRVRTHGHRFPRGFSHLFVPNPLVPGFRRQSCPGLGRFRVLFSGQEPKSHQDAWPWICGHNSGCSRAPETLPILCKLPGSSKSHEDSLVRR